MPEQTVILNAADGTSGRAVAHLERYSSTARVGKAIFFVLAGILGAAACIIVPVLHLITTWAFPLAGIVLCVKTLRTRERLVSIAGPCPSCGAPVELPGGAMTDSRTCPSCQAVLKVADSHDQRRETEHD